LRATVAGSAVGAFNIGTGRLPWRDEPYSFLGRVPASPDYARFGDFSRAVVRTAWGSHIDALADFRKRAALLTPAEEKLYREHPRVQ
jgi:hypothetical protein